MGGGGSKGGCPWTNQGDAINNEKNICYKRIDEIRRQMDSIDQYDIYGKANYIRQLRNISDKIKVAYRDAKYREKVRDDLTKKWEGDIKDLIDKIEDPAKKSYYQHTILFNNSEDAYTKTANYLQKLLNDYANISGNNNVLQDTINRYSKKYYDSIISQNNILESRNTDPQYKDLYSTDKQKINYAANDNEYLRTLNFVFLVIYYILVLFVVYIIYSSKLTTFYKVIMIFIILLYPLFIYEFQHYLHYLWVKINNPML
jgi:hypothetical protein